MVTYFLIILCLFPKTSGISLQIVVLLPLELYRQQGGVLEDALAAQQTDDGVKFNATSVVITNTSGQSIAKLCEEVELRNPNLILSLLQPPDSFFASLIAGYIGIPVLGMTSAYTDYGAQEVNPLYISMDAGATNLADATFHFLSANRWFQVVLLTDNSKFSISLTRRITELSRASSEWNRLKIIHLYRTEDSASVFDQLSTVINSEKRVVLLSCDTNTAYLVFQEASKLVMLSGHWIWVLLKQSVWIENDYPVGMLALRLRPVPFDLTVMGLTVDILSSALRNLNLQALYERFRNQTGGASCWEVATNERKKVSSIISKIIKVEVENRKKTIDNPQSNETWVPPIFDIVNLVPVSYRSELQWKLVGNVTRQRVNMNTVLWLGDSRTGPKPSASFRHRVVTGYAPPFVQQSTRVENGSCLQGVPCLYVNTSRKEEIIRIFAAFSAGVKNSTSYNVTCCAGISIDLLTSVARDLVFDYDLYVVADGYFGTNRGQKWNGITADLISGAAHLTFSAYSMTSKRSEAVDFSVPYFHSGVSCLTYSQFSDVPLSAFLVPFSVELWVAIFAGLTMTAVAAAIYEWLSPFGLNPWGRQRTKNFSVASALWVMWSLLFSHLVAFKAPKSWPNKVLINLWGCFSVIFLASYTANIAALFAGLFSQSRVDDFHDESLLSQRTGTAKGSATEGFVHTENSHLWQHIQKYGVDSLTEGLQKLRKDELDVLIGDTAVLNYFRGNDPGCGLHLLGDSIFDHAYAVGMQRGFPLKEAISKLILQYNEFGYLDQLQKKWYGRVPCFEDSVHRLNKPLPLSIRALAGVFIMLGVGILVGILILLLEHLVFKYSLPILRKKPKDCFWRSPNLMFFSQKLYRFVNTVELVSPHHSAKEIVSNLREGQIASLFQKSVKRKIKEEARRRKSKSQFFEMIQEIRKVTKQQSDPKLPSSDEVDVQLSDQDQDDGVQEIVVHTNDRKPRYRKHTTFSESRQCRSPCEKDNIADDPRSKLIASYHSDSEESAESSIPTSSSLSSVEFIKRNGISISLNDLTKCQSSDYINPIHGRKYGWSFDDLSALKGDMCYEDVDTELKAADCDEDVPSNDVDEFRLRNMSKEEIIRSWQASERTLMNRLQEALKEKKALEEKLAFIQKTLLKPP